MVVILPAVALAIGALSASLQHGRMLTAIATIPLVEAVIPETDRRSKSSDYAGSSQTTYDCRAPDSWTTWGVCKIVDMGTYTVSCFNSFANFMFRDSTSAETMHWWWKLIRLATSAFTLLLNGFTYTYLGDLIATFSTLTIQQ